MALSGTVNTESYEGRYVSLTWTGQQDILTNTTTISWTLKGAGTASASWYYAGPFKITIGKTVVYESDTRIKLYNGTVIKSGSYSITHNTDGGKSITIQVKAAIYASGYNKSGEKTFSLNSIPRKATVTSAVNFNDEENLTISYNNPAGTKVTTLQACIANGTNVIVPYRDISKSKTSYTFKFTESERNKLRQVCATANSMNVRIYIKTTISSTTYHHYITKKLTIINATPTLNPTAVEDTDPGTDGGDGAGNVEATGSNMRWLKGISDIRYAFNAVAKKGASIKTYSVVCGSKKGSSASGVLANIDSDSVQFTVIDSRGNKATKTIKGTIINYFKPTCSLKVIGSINTDADTTTTSVDDNTQDTNTNSTAAQFDLTISGQFFNGNIKPNIENSLKLEYRIMNKDTNNVIVDWTEITSNITINQMVYTTEQLNIKQDSAGNPLNYQTTYGFQAQVTDDFGVVKSAEISLSAQPIFDWGKTDFNFNVPVRLSKRSYATENQEKAGSSYTNSTAEIYVPSGGGLFLPNSDINGVNGLFFNYDIVDNVGEGIFFPLYNSKREKGGAAYINERYYQRYGQLYISRSGNLKLILGVIPGVLTLEDMVQATTVGNLSTAEGNWWDTTPDGKYQYVMIIFNGTIASTSASPYQDLLLNTYN